MAQGPTLRARPRGIAAHAPDFSWAGATIAAGRSRPLPSLRGRGGDRRRTREHERQSPPSAWVTRQKPSIQQARERHDRPRCVHLVAGPRKLSVLPPWGRRHRRGGKQRVRGRFSDGRRSSPKWAGGRQKVATFEGEAANVPSHHRRRFVRAEERQVSAPQPGRCATPFGFGCSPIGDGDQLFVLGRGAHLPSAWAVRHSDADVVSSRPRGTPIRSARRRRHRELGILLRTIAVAPRPALHPIGSWPSRSRRWLRSGGMGASHHPPHLDVTNRVRGAGHSALTRRAMRAPYRRDRRHCDRAGRRREGDHE